MKKKVIVCGAGIGGLVTALRLRAGGNDVCIYEKNASPGGKMSEIRRDGFRFDTGPSLITMPHILEELFSSLGKDISDYLTLIKLETSCRYFWEDGTVFNWYSDEERLKQEISDVFGATERDNFMRAIEYGKLFYELSNQSFLEGEFRLRNFLTTEGIRNAAKFISGRSMNDVANKFFRDPKMKQLFNRFATYNGSSPYLCPQFFSIIPYTEHRYGPWYVKGGIFEIAKSLSQLCSELGIEVKLGYSLKDFDHKSGSITSLEFEDTSGNSSAVTAFSDVVLNFTSLRGSAGTQYFKNDDWSSSGFIIFAGMKLKCDALAHHNVFFSENYEEEFLEIFERKVPPSDMTVYVSISSKDEPGDCPVDCENWFVLVNTPFINEKSDWSNQFAQKYSDSIFDKLNSFSHVFDVNVRNNLLFTEFFTPVDFREKYGSEFGSIYGLSSNSLYTLMKRPRNRSQYYRNLFFTGGNSHPGGGVPLCFLSGKIVAEMISGEASKN